MEVDIESRVASFLRSLQPFSFAYRDLLGQHTLPSWTPTLTFATPGDLSVTYSANGRVGRYFKMGPVVIAFFNVVTTAFTHTTAAGNCRIITLPYTSASITSLIGEGHVRWGGITKANYTHVQPRVGSNTAIINFTASGSAQANANVDAADVPTGGTVTLAGFVLYFTAK